LAVALVVGSVLFAMTQRSFGEWLILVPGLVFKSYAFWQPVTYAFIETSPMGVIFGALIAWSIGGALEQTWGPRRLVGFAIGVTVLAGLCTLALSYPVGALWARPFAGGTVMTSALWVAYGLSFGQRQTNFWGMPVTGNVLALIGVGFVFLNGAFQSWLGIIPEVFALGLTFLYLKVGTPRLLWLRFTSWRLHRQLKSRSKHLTLLSDERNTPRDSDRFLH
jgi:membrane associated rhomboid family serine protease